MRLTVFFITLLTIWLCVGTLILINFSSFNPLYPDFAKRETIIKFFPQGWAFFTRNPREASLYVYDKKGGKFICRTKANLNFYFGAGRNMRVEDGEMSYLLNQVSSKRWKKCKGKNLLDCAKITSKIEVKNDYLHPKLCGEIIVKRQDTTPWAWSRSNVSMQFELIKLKVICLSQ